MENSEYLTKTFMDIPNREWALDTAEARFLRKNVPEHIWDKLVTLYLETGLNSPEADIVLSFILENSQISRSVKQRPSDAGPFEQIYRKKPPADPIDEYYVRSKGALGIFMRLLSLKDILPNLIREENNLYKNGEYTVLNVGSGPGHDTIEIMAEHLDLSNKIKIICVDPDIKSIELGKRKVSEFGLNNRFEFIPKKLEEVPPMGADMILLIGMLCPIRSKKCIQILRNLQFFSKPKGIIVYSTVQEKMIFGDPLLDVFMRILGWHMDFKTEEEADRLALESNWKKEDVFFDAIGFNRMTIARLA